MLNYFEEKSSLMNGSEVFVGSKIKDVLEKENGEGENEKKE